MKTLWAITFGVLCGLLGAGIILVASSSPRGQPVELLPLPTPRPIVVHISGAVAQPGVYALLPDTRVHTALEAAGGILPTADESAINLAAFLQDGARVWIPYQTIRQPQITPSIGVFTAPSDAQGQPVSPPQSGLVDINTADQSGLESLPGIGPVIAGRIIAYRQEHGSFATIEDIQNVPGIGPTRFEQIKDLITVVGNP